MSEFDEWPVDVVEDLRIYREPDDEDRDYRMVYSFDLDALTPVNLDEAEHLRAKGVLEITELPD